MFLKVESDSLTIYQNRKKKFQMPFPEDSIVEIAKKFQIIEYVYKTYSKLMLHILLRYPFIEDAED